MMHRIGRGLRWGGRTGGLLLRESLTAYGVFCQAVGVVVVTGTLLLGFCWGHVGPRIKQTLFGSPACQMRLYAAVQQAMDSDACFVPLAGPVKLSTQR